MYDNHVEELKQSLKQNVIHIKTFGATDALLFSCPKNTYIIFDNVALKNYFVKNTDHYVVNCNSSYEKFLEDMEHFDTRTIFNNVNFCNDLSILTLIDNTNNTRID